MPVEVHNVLYSYPVYLPEIDYMIFLDVSSNELNKKILSEFSAYSGLRSAKELIFQAKLYNFNKENRAVTWGNIQSYVFEKKLRDLYQCFYYLVNFSLRITPSIILGNKLISPNRWALLSTETHTRIFSTKVSLNVFPVYIEKEALKNIKKRQVFLPLPMTLYEIKATALEFFPTGNIHILNIPLHFVDHPSREFILSEIEGSGEYYIVYAFSFLDVNTSGNNKMINIVENIMPLYPIDILLGLSVMYMESQEIGKLIWRINFNRANVERIRRVLSKRSASIYLHGAWIDLISSKFYPFFNIEENGTHLSVRAINPGFLAHMFRRIFFEKGHEDNIFLLKKLQELFSMLEEYNEIQQKKGNASIVELLGYKRQFEEKYRKKYGKGVWNLLVRASSIVRIREYVLRKYRDIILQHTRR
ncbi:hypothetical protein K1720_00695 [Thermococcus argininiproducens]|uniref:Uncharacterized protein n=1 Tax=Thermococcus argininiproducens TaxID=2866384 RepID=A0A9E7SD11_9EURY|nr:hypothetical protein [Thermococcus argininiproducens]USH00042.1 hypothetical protein K1720_00695 [Thermococcus argininiproducens]